MARRADVDRPDTVFALVERGDVLRQHGRAVRKWGEPAVRAAIAAPAVYLDSTGEPAFIRRVFEEFGPAAARRRGDADDRDGLRLRAGRARRARSRSRTPASGAVRVDVGYYALGAGPGSLSRGTRASLVGAALGARLRLPRRRAADRARRPSGCATSRSAASSRPAISVGGAEHFTLPAAYPRLREVNVYLGWFGPLARAVAGRLAGRLGRDAVPGVAAAGPGGRRAAGRRRAAGPAPGTTPGGLS